MDPDIVDCLNLVNLTTSVVHNSLHKENNSPFVTFFPAILVMIFKSKYHHYLVYPSSCVKSLLLDSFTRLFMLLRNTLNLSTSCALLAGVVMHTAGTILYRGETVDTMPSVCSALWAITKRILLFLDTW